MRLNPFKLTIGFLFLLFFQIQVLAQSPNMDSLLSTIPTERNEAYIDHLLQITIFHPVEDTAIHYGLEAIGLARKIKYHKSQASLAHTIGAHLNNQGKYKEALPYFDEALEQYDLAGVPEKKAKTLRTQSISFRFLGQNKEALEALQKGLNIAKEHDEKKELAFIYSTLGQLYQYQHDVERAINYFELAEGSFNELEMYTQVCRNKLQMASTWKVSLDSLEKQKGIETLFEIMKSECWEKSNDYTRGIVNTTLGSMLVNEGKIKQGEKFLMQGYEIKKKNNFQSSLLYTYLELTTLYAATEKNQEAIEYGELALSKIDSFPNPNLEYDILRNLATAYSYSGNYKKGFFTMARSRELENATRGEKQQAALLELETKYEVSQKEKEIANRDLEIVRQENRFSKFVLMAVLAIGILGGLYFWYRSKTKRKILEAEQIKEMDRLRSTFFTNVSHEFRTPLSLILAPVQKWENRLSNQAANNKIEIDGSDINQMGRSARRLNQLVDQLLDLAKMDAGKMMLKIAKGDIVIFSENILSAFNQIAERKNIQLQFASFKEPFEIYFDQDILEKILNNLLSNALKFTPDNGKIKLMLNEKNGKAEITLSDSGPGVSAAELPLIFNRFYQAESNQKDQGTGVGLALVKELVELHKGKIRVESKEGKGTTFVISLPLEKAHFKPSEIVEATSEFIPAILPKTNGLSAIANGDEIETAEHNPTECPTILIVEDNDDLRNYLSKSLHHEFEVLMAADGNLGWKVATEKIPDLIISDIMMPGMNGDELSRKLKANQLTGHIPIILLTAKATREDELSGLQTGADDYVVKPFDEEILIQKTKNLIEQRNKLKLLFAEKVELWPHELNVQSHDEGFLKKLLEIVETNMGNTEFSVEKLSIEIGMSRSQLFRKLKALTGETPTSFIRNIRLRRANQLLQQKYGTANEVSYAVGFSNPTYFFRIYKDMFDMTPGETIKKAGEI